MVTELVPLGSCCYLLPTGAYRCWDDSHDSQDGETWEGELRGPDVVAILKSQSTATSTVL